MSWYVTDNLNVANALLDLLNTEVIAAMTTKVYMVEEVDASWDQTNKFAVYNEAGTFKGWIRIMTSGRITTKYADLITHKDGGLYAIPILQVNYYKVEDKVKEQALQYGYIVNKLGSDWFPTTP